MKISNKAITIWLCSWFIAAAMLRIYWSYYLHQSSYRGWGEVATVMMIIGILPVRFAGGFKPLGYRRFPSTPNQWVLQIGLFLLIIVGIVIVGYQAYERYYGGLFQTLSNDDLDAQ